ncbi:universal stress protein [Streptomyces lincolnensis]|uniref:universal stress protein n=1 Tax=Streptomyces lincolnensis TaxID=1915 RepID=UPI001E5435FD|nr:universal stress protein [Streptomyces lincolnensis]MCD7442281.1 universal stress protein [Streptomyces lincolnensis]
MVRYVVAGVDASPESLAAAHWAAREALRRGAPLRIVHVWQWHPHPSTAVPLGTAQRDWAERTLNGVVAGVRAAHPELEIVDHLVRSDSVVTALVAAADEAEVSVLGSQGLGAFAGFVVGSVSQRVVARSTRPVVVVRAGATAADDHLPVADGISPDEIPDIPSRDVVLGLDTGHPCDELIEFAFQSARRYGATLHVLHVYGASGQLTDDAGPGPAPGPELLARHEHAVVATLRSWGAKFPDVSVVETVREGRVAGELVRACSGASLAVVGRRTRAGRPGGHIGPVTHAVLHHVRCPVAVVPHD